MGSLRRVRNLRQSQVTYAASPGTTLEEAIDYMQSVYGEAWATNHVEYRPKEVQAWWRIGWLKAMEIERIHVIITDDAEAL